jgi:hypothetical protein
MYSRGGNRTARYHSALGSARETLACLKVAEAACSRQRRSHRTPAGSRQRAEVGTLARPSPSLASDCEVWSAGQPSSSRFRNADPFCQKYERYGSRERGESRGDQGVRVSVRMTGGASGRFEVLERDYWRLTGVQNSIKAQVRTLVNGVSLPPMEVTMPTAFDGAGWRWACTDSSLVITAQSESGTSGVFRFVQQTPSSACHYDFETNPSGGGIHVRQFNSTIRPPPPRRAGGRAQARAQAKPSTARTPR